MAQYSHLINLRLNDFDMPYTAHSTCPKMKQYQIALPLPKLEKEIVIKITLKQIKRLNIRVKSEGVVVSAPKSYSKQTIKHILTQHADWITNRLTQHDERLKSLPTLSMNEILYLGKVQTVSEIISSMNRLDVKELLNVFAENGDVSKQRLIKWYKLKAAKLLTVRTGELSLNYALPFNKVSTREAKYRWGSCNSKRNISLNCKLILAPEYVIDAIILHELTHTEHLNHGEKFWSKLRKICPQWDSASSWLTQYNPLIQRIFNN